MSRHRVDFAKQQPEPVNLQDQFDKYVAGKWISAAQCVRMIIVW